MKSFMKSRLSPFTHSHFRNYYLAQTLSQVGRWSHDLARAWVILELVGKASALGLISLMMAIPSAILLLHTGVVVDKVNVKKLMVTTKLLLLFLALLMFYLIEFTDYQLWQILVIGFLEGIIISFDNPAFSALLVRLVPKKDFSQALVLNTTNFHAGRMLGPFVAGMILHWTGKASYVFLFDVIGYTILVAILLSIKLIPIKTKLTPLNHFQSMIEGFQHFFGHPRLRFMLFQLYLTIAVFLPLSIVIYKTYIQKKFQLSGDEFGFVFSISSMGAALGALSFTFYKPKTPLKALLFSVPLVIFFVSTVPLMPTPLTAAINMCLSGFMAYFCFSSLTVSLHIHIQEEFRGRLSSYISLGFLCLGPFLCYPMGVLGDEWGYVSTTYGLISIYAFGTILLTINHLRSLKVSDARSRNE